MSGFIYILINPSMPSLLKIGRTTRSPDDRAKELSSSTGVALAFSVAYQAYVSDEILVERLIHDDLESRGFRANSSREFFEIPLREAVTIVQRVCDQYPADSESTQEDDEVISASDIYRLGLDYLQGTDTVFQDFEAAKACFSRAHSLGHPIAAVYLADCYLWGIGVRSNSKEAIRILRLSGENKNELAWYRLWEIFAGVAINYHADEYINFTDEANPTNAALALRNYLEVLQKSGTDTDIETLKRFIPKLTDSNLPQDSRSLELVIELWIRFIGNKLQLIKSGRLKGLVLDQIIDPNTGGSVSLGCLLDFTDYLKSHDILVDKYLKSLLSDVSVSDLRFAFSRLPISSIEMRIDSYKSYLVDDSGDVAFPSAPLSAELVGERRNTGKKSFWKRLF